MYKNKNNKAVSIIETLIVVTIFALIAAIASQSISLSLRGARKSDSISDVREELDFAMSIIKRELRDASEIPVYQNITQCSVTGTERTWIVYKDQNKDNKTVYCDLDDDDPNPYSLRIQEIPPAPATPPPTGSNPLTSDKIRMTACSFICKQPNASVPPSIEILVTGQDADAAEPTSITVETQVRLRVY